MSQRIQEEFTRAIQAMKEGKYPQAIQYFEQSLKLYQSTASNIGSEHAVACYFNIGEIKKGIGDFKGAISAYQNVLALDPKQESTYLKLASCCFEVGTYNSMETALNALAECTSRFPRNQAAFMNLGIGYLKIDAKDEARSTLPEDFSMPVKISQLCLQPAVSPIQSR